jgi:pimeloyl-ACP methyl ester carboxylesterase
MKTFFLNILFFISVLFSLDRTSAQSLRCVDLWIKRPTISSNVIQLMNAHKESEIQQGVTAPHQSQFLLHKKDQQIIKTEVVILVYHGLMNSPKDMKFLAKDLHETGANVINARLDGHFEKSRNELDSIEYQDWVNQLNGYLSMAQQLGKKVILVGHSTGGLAGIHTAIQNKVDGLVLLAPALKIRTLNEALTYVGSVLNISGWILDAFRNFRNDRYKSTHAAVQVDLWSDILRDLPGEKISSNQDYGLVKERLADTPVLWLDTELDWVIDAQYNRQIAEGLQDIEYFNFPKTSAVIHNSIAVPKMNRDYPQMVEMIQAFIKKQ